MTVNATDPLGLVMTAGEIALLLHLYLFLMGRQSQQHRCLWANDYCYVPAHGLVLGGVKGAGAREDVGKRLVK